MKTQFIVGNLHPVALIQPGRFDPVAVQKHALLQREILQHVAVAAAFD